MTEPLHLTEAIAVSPNHALRRSSQAPVPHPQGDRIVEKRSEDALLDAARAFEAAFIAQMLAHSGLGDPPEAFGGGAGEAQFAGLLRDAQAAELAKSGGIGLAEFIVKAMAEAGHDR